MYSVGNLVNTYKILESKTPPIDQEFCIYAYFLFNEPKDGKYGKQIFLGAYATKKKAFEEAEKIVKQTGHDSIYICETCTWEDIDSVKRFDRTFKLDPKLKSEELEKQFQLDISRQEEKRKKNEEIDLELERQQEKEFNNETIEHYAHNWFNAIKNKSSYEYHKSQMEHYEKSYLDRVTKIREQHSKQPEFENEWLILYQDRLNRRNENDVYKFLLQGHALLKDEILNKH